VCLRLVGDPPRGTGPAPPGRSILTARPQGRSVC
jgi:hypothetical protein